ncbi:hypothetical protein FOVG_01380 [Fusarium oxysporum f. sp. pisi HDV247]|uniref:Uncharacterized protein n=1 Tax=Fusarium oxysporum f. sp. pisi HDV247 TaxID=1080344 RepID=W9QGY3_FUSOX|nr:hypothetical protein FOVG_01380 [Fusarium oxysporum f. sp. pisi HDV247]
MAGREHSPAKSVKLPLLQRVAPWHIASESIQDFVGEAHVVPPEQWRKSILSELTVVNITVSVKEARLKRITSINSRQGALIAAVVSSAFSWPTIDDSPWTTRALFYSALILSLVSVSAGSQQSIALYRLGGHDIGLTTLRTLLKGSGKQGASKLQLYVWQMPIMLLNVSILLFVIGLMILIWDRAAMQSSWDQDPKIALVASIAGLYALINYGIGTLSIYRIGTL